MARRAARRPPPSAYASSDFCKRPECLCRCGYYSTATMKLTACPPYAPVITQHPGVGMSTPTSIVHPPKSSALSICGRRNYQGRCGTIQPGSDDDQLRPWLRSSIVTGSPPEDFLAIAFLVLWKMPPSPVEPQTCPQFARAVPERALRKSDGIWWRWNEGRIGWTSWRAAARACGCRCRTNRTQ